jgi:hypothetical protein
MAKNTNGASDNLTPIGLTSGRKVQVDKEVAGDLVKARMEANDLRYKVSDLSGASERWTAENEELRKQVKELNAKLATFSSAIRMRLERWAYYIRLSLLPECRFLLFVSC